METRQDVKRWLWRYRHYKRMSDHINSDIEELQTTIDGLKAQRLTGMPSGSTGRSYSLEETMDRIEEKKKEMLNALNDMLDVREEIEEAISGLEDDVLKEIMRLRYISGKRWETICEEMHYSWTQTHRQHKKALDIILRNAYNTHKKT